MINRSFSATPIIILTALTQKPLADIAGISDGRYFFIKLITTGEKIMQLLVMITNQTEKVPGVLSGFMEAGIRGASVIDCEGMLAALDRASIEPPSIFGSLRKFINPENELNKMLVVLLPADVVPKAKDVIHSVIGQFNKPNTGVMFTLPVLDVEGIGGK